MLTATETQAIERAWNSVTSGYPEADIEFLIDLTAQTSGESKSDVLEHLGSQLSDEVDAVLCAAAEGSGVTDWQDYDPNRWNLH